MKAFISVLFKAWEAFLTCSFFYPSWFTVVNSLPPHLPACPPACLPACLPCSPATGFPACLPATATQPPSWELSTRWTLTTGTRLRLYRRKHRTKSYSPATTSTPHGTPPACHLSPSCTLVFHCFTNKYWLLNWLIRVWVVRLGSVSVLCHNKNPWFKGFEYKVTLSVYVVWCHSMYVLSTTITVSCINTSAVQT